MDIAVVARNTEVAERFRTHLEDKLSKVEQLAPRAHRIEVEITREQNPRLADQAERVELTVIDRDADLVPCSARPWRRGFARRARR